ncbi:MULTISPECIES: hypothetical protein [unclassified Wolbachia]|uniref:hypothetical protein n=1 Tax=unclassified Wolbachia TaxID=2640676 RepID=UPI0021F89A23|nr:MULTISPECIES: hypothetical protein [unclassified Wolbachia]
MSLNYHNLKEHPRNFRDVTGLKIEEFEKIVEKCAQSGKKFKNRRNAMEERQDCLYWKIKYSV